MSILSPPSPPVPELPFEDSSYLWGHAPSQNGASLDLGPFVRAPATRPATLSTFLVLSLDNFVARAMFSCMYKKDSGVAQITGARSRGLVSDPSPSIQAMETGTTGMGLLESWMIRAHETSSSGASKPVPFVLDYGRHYRRHRHPCTCAGNYYERQVQVCRPYCLHWSGCPFRERETILTISHPADHLISHPMCIKRRAVLCPRLSHLGNAYGVDLAHFTIPIGDKQASGEP